MALPCTIFTKAYYSLLRSTKIKLSAQQEGLWMHRSYFNPINSVIFN
ncbi:hypothetical protein SAMN02745124_00804 [Desulfofustis glycolicus DSM 9705]|uniref:Uncharacterized protein n=1 Tax=Desulfofustis glycolicus DSM 9705 TaxID=1121409 RepID=A0A1M5TMF6_9BACT|nr:hypothetical protein SAMN02745124_00804 [Desulfofustis glycolicus DSM 9705]